MAEDQPTASPQSPVEVPPEPFSEVPGVICGRCDGKGWTMKDKNVKECVACLGTGLER